MGCSASKKPSADAPADLTVYGRHRCVWTRRMLHDLEAHGVVHRVVWCDSSACAHVSAVPTLIFSNGTRVVGYTAMTRVQTELSKIASRSSTT